jgi:hypothetical protein
MRLILWVHGLDCEISATVPGALYFELCTLFGLLEIRCKVQSANYKHQAQSTKLYTTFVNARDLE